MSPENTGPGSFARRLASELTARGFVFLPEDAIPKADLYYCSAFFSNAPLNACKHRLTPAVLRVDGLGAAQDFDRVRNSYKAADVVIFQSEYSSKLFKSTHQFEPVHSFVIHNGVEIKPYERLYNRYANEFVSICNTWNKHRYQNFLDVIYKNLPAIKRAIPNFCWTIVGKYQEFKDVMIDVDNMPIKFIQFRPDINYLRQIAKGCIHIVPTDSCPNSVIESLEQGVPCIVWHDSGGPELIGKGGIVLNSDDPYEVIDAIRQISSKHEEYSLAARQQAETCLDIKLVANKYEEVFKNARTPQGASWNKLLQRSE